MPKFTLLWTDIFMLGLVFVLLAYGVCVVRKPNLRRAWEQVASDAPAMCAAVILAVFLLVAVLDSIHYRPMVANTQGEPESGQSYSPVVRSLLDDILDLTSMGTPESTYSAPLALYQFTKETRLVDGQAVREYPRLKHAGQGLQDDQHSADLRRLLAWGLGLGLLVAAVAAALLTISHRSHTRS